MAVAESLIVKLRLVAGLDAEERRIVGALAVHQRNETLIGKFFFAAVGDGDFGRALQRHVAFIGAESVRRQAFHQAAAFHAANGRAPAVRREGLVIRAPARKRRCPTDTFRDPSRPRPLRN